MQRLQALVDTNPRAALPRIDLALARLSRKGPGADQRAWLLATRTAALVGLVRYEDAEKTARSALAEPGLNTSVRTELLNQLVAVSFSRPEPELKGLLGELSALRARQPVTSPAWVCATNTMSILQRALGSTEDALQTAGNAYRAAKTARLDSQAAYIAINLSALILPTGDLEQADDLARESETWAERKGYTHQLLLAAFMRAQAAVHYNPPLAAASFTKASELAGQLGMPSGAADQGACDALLAIGKLDAAEAACLRATRNFDASDFIPRVLTDRLMGDIAMARGNPAKALTHYDTALARASAPALGKVADLVRQRRAEAYAKLGRYPEAYADLKLVNANVAARTDAQRARDLANARARFGWDRQRLANAELERDLAKADARDAARRLWLWTAGGWAGLLAATLTWVVLTGKRHRRKLEGLAEEAKSLARTKADLLANMSHEIRSPLGSLTLAASRLSQSPDIPPDGRARAERLGQAGDRLMALLDDLLLFSRIDARQLPITPAPFDPAALVREVASLAEPKAQAAGAVVAVEVGAAMPATVVGDRNRLAQILTNLLDNAVRHAEATRITVSLGPVGSDLYRITVTDDGKGIPPDRREYMFQRFSQIDGATASAEGSGLGLAICKGLAELQGGTITIEDAERGVRACLTLPVTLAQPQSLATLAQAA